MRRIIVFLALLCMVSPGVAQRARVDYDHGSRFSRFKTYRWVQSGATELTESQFPNQLMHERIVSFVDEALAARGLKRVPAGGDLLVGFQMNVSAQQQFTTVGSGWGWGSNFSTTTEQTIWIGTLVVNLTDPHQQQLVFQGVSSATISSRPQRNSRRLQKAVNKIFEKYPPQL